jgi:ATP-dependent DNA helicase RecG
MNTPDQNDVSTALGLPEKDYPKASRIIRESIEAELVKPYDPENRSRKHAKYLPFWA